MAMSRTRWFITATCVPCARKYQQVGILSRRRCYKNASAVTLCSPCPPDADDAYHKGENSLVLFVSLTVDNPQSRFFNESPRCHFSTGKQTGDEIMLQTLLKDSQMSTNWI